MTAEQEQVRERILAALANSQLQPTELLDLLENQFPESALKDIVVRLLQEGTIELTPTRHLHVAATR